MAIPGALGRSALTNLAKITVTTFRNYLFPTVSITYGQFPKSMVRFGRSACQDGTERATTLLVSIFGGGPGGQKAARRESQSRSIERKNRSKSFRLRKGDQQKPL